MLKSIGTALAACLAMSGTAQAAEVILTFDVATDPNPAPACATFDGGPTTTLCTGSFDYIGADYGSTSQLGVTYDASGSQTSLQSRVLEGDGAAEVFSEAANDPSRIFFTPTSGNEVSFRSFDWIKGSATSSQHFAFRVLDDQGATLFSAGNGAGDYIVNTAYYTGALTFEFTNGGQGRVAVDDIALDVRAIGAGAVPEPASWALLIVGFGGIGAGMRRKQGKYLRFA